MEEIKSIGSVIESVVREMGINKKINISNIFNHWEKIVGHEIAKRSRPHKLVNMTLYISVSSSTWANELSLMSEDLIMNINSFAGDKVVKKVRFKAGY